MFVIASACHLSFIKIYHTTTVFLFVFATACFLQFCHKSIRIFVCYCYCLLLQFHQNLSYPDWLFLFVFAAACYCFVCYCCRVLLFCLLLLLLVIEGCNAESLCSPTKLRLSTVPSQLLERHTSTPTSHVNTRKKHHKEKCRGEL